MDVVLSKSTVAPGDSLTFRASITEGGGAPGDEHTTLQSNAGEPVTDATVRAQVTRPGSSIPDPAFDLTNNGNGTYGGVYWNKRFPGTYDLQIVATVPNPANVDSPFVRISRQSFYVTPLTTPSSVVVLGTDGVTVGDYAVVSSGDVIVNNKLSLAGPQLTVGTGVTVTNPSILAANSVGITSGAFVSADVYYNTLTGATSGTKFQGLTDFPLVWMPGFQYGEPATSASADIDVPNGTTNVTLPPGKYRDVYVEPHATLKLSGGIYHIRNLWAKTDTKVLAAAASDLRVLGGFALDNGSTIGPANSSVSAKNIVVYVGTDDAHSPFGTAVNVSPKAFVTANLYAENGTILLASGTQATGAFIGKTVVVGKSTTVSLNSAFNGVLPLFTGKYKQAVPGTAAREAMVPKEFSVDQNFPNPFNPSTQIRYGLPEDDHVTVTIHNMLGQIVATLVDEGQTAGFHEVRWDGHASGGSTVGSGVYVYRVQAGAFVQTRKMILLK